MLEFNGTITKVLDTEVETKNGLQPKKTFMVEQGDQYPDKLVFEMLGEERLKDADIAEGNAVKVKYFANASEYNGKLYNRLNAVSVKKEAGDAAVDNSASNVQVENQGLPF